MKSVMLTIILLTALLSATAAMSPVAASSDQATNAELSAFTLPGLPSDGTDGNAGGGDRMPPSIVIGTTTVPVVTTTAPVAPTGSSYAQARAYYVSGSTAWSNAWGASDFTLIRQYLTQAKTEFTRALTTANAVSDPANTANLALVRSVSTAYIALADAALAMYDGTDAYSAGQTQMNAANYAAAATSFQTAADRSDASKTLFGQATTTLQSVIYAGTEYGDGSAYTAVILPILNDKAQYVGDYATYARAWQHTALAFQGTASGNQATFRSEATQAMNLFAGLRTNPTFGADATTNYNILVGMLGSNSTVTPTQTPTVSITTRTTTVTPTPTQSEPTSSTPAIRFTHIPPRSSSDTYVSGQVSGVSFSQYRVTLYIRVRGDWWGPKPYWNSPLTPIADDGSWRTTFVTGGVDDEATEFAAYLVPSSYDPPDISWSTSLPQQLSGYPSARASR